MNAVLYGTGRAALSAAGRIYLHPGQLAVAAEPCTLTTILGSCVGVSLYDPVRRAGGLNHFLLPRAREERTPRFGDISMMHLIREVVRLGAKPSRIQARVFGGACVLDAFRERRNDLGLDNVAMALESLESAGITVVERQTAGHRGRRVTFDPHSGITAVRSL